MARSMSDQTLTEQAINRWAAQQFHHTADHADLTWQQRHDREPSYDRVTCTDCGWIGFAFELKAQACPVCDGRVADV